jgi:hypothetical protein
MLKDQIFCAHVERNRPQNAPCGVRKHGESPC